jgi:hypothetical protein
VKADYIDYLDYQHQLSTICRQFNYGRNSRSQSMENAEAQN